MNVPDTSTIAPNNPFVGPKSIDEGQKIFGREVEIEAIYDQLTAKRVVLLYSPSGAGKTSVIQAGLIPRLRTKFEVWGPLRVNAEPKDVSAGVNRYTLSIKAGILPAASPAELSPALTMLDFVKLRRKELRKHKPNERDKEGESENIVLVIDQFEEVLTTDPLGRETKLAFFKELGALLQADKRLWALLVMREDYLAQLDPYCDQLPTRLNNRFRLDLLGNAEAQKVIESLAASGVPNRTFTQPAIERLIKDLSTVKVQDATGKIVPALGQYVEPLYLQVVCQNLWNKKDAAIAAAAPVFPKSDTVIDEDDVVAFGQVTDALATYYSDKVAEIAARVNPTLVPAASAAFAESSGPEAAAHSALNAKRLGEAERAFESILKLTPDDARAIAGMGYLRMQQGNFGAAISFFSDAKQAGLTDTDVDAAVETSRSGQVAGLRIERRIREWIGRLITPAGTRGQVQRGEGKTGELGKELDNDTEVAALVASHLIRGEQRAGATWYELSHDRLIQPVQESNRVWLEMNLKPFQKAAALWTDQGEPKGLLLVGDLLEAANKDAAALPLDIHETKFLDASRDEQKALDEKQESLERERRQAKRIRMWLQVALGAFTVATVALIVARYQFHEAQREHREALVTSARKQLSLPGGTGIALGTLAAALRLDSSSTTARALISDLLQTKGWWLPENSIAAGRPLDSWAVSPNGKTLLTGTVSNEFEPGEDTMWDIATGKQKSTPLDYFAGRQKVGFSRDGNRLFLISNDQHGTWYLHIYDARTQRSLLRIPFQSEILSADFGPDGTRIAVGLAVGNAEIYGSDGQRVSGYMLPDKSRVNFVQFSPDGSLLLATSENGPALLLNAMSSVNLSPLRVLSPGAAKTVLTARFNKSGTAVLTTSHTSANYWNLGSLPANNPANVSAPATPVEFDPDAPIVDARLIPGPDISGSGKERLLIVTVDQKATVWDVDAYSRYLRCRDAIPEASKPAQAPPPPKLTPDQMTELNKVGPLVAEGRNDDAMVIYRKVLSTTPPPGELARAYYDTEAGTADGKAHAIAGLRSLVAEYPGNADFQITLGRILTLDPITRPEGRRILANFLLNPQAMETLRQALVWDGKLQAGSSAGQVGGAQLIEKALDKSGSAGGNITNTSLGSGAFCTKEDLAQFKIENPDWHSKGDTPYRLVLQLSGTPASTALSDDGTSLVVVDINDVAQTWDLTSYQPLGVQIPSVTQINSGAFLTGDPSSRRLVSSYGESAQIWKLPRTGQSDDDFRAIETASAVVSQYDTSVHLSADWTAYWEDYFGPDGTVWGKPGMGSVHLIRPFPNDSLVIYPSPDRKHVLLSAQGNTAAPDSLTLLTAPSTLRTFLHLDALDRKLYEVRYVPSIFHKLLHLGSSRQIGSPLRPDSQYQFSANGKRLLRIDLSYGFAQILDTDTGDAFLTFPLGGPNFDAATGRSGCFEALLKLHESSGSAPKNGDLTAAAGCLNLSPHSDQQALLKAWQSRLAAAVDIPSTVLLSPDGQTLFTNSAKSALIWNISKPDKSGEVLPPRNVGPPQSVPTSFAFSSSGDLALGFQDRTVRIYSLPSLNQITGFELTSPAAALAFSPDGTELFAATDRGYGQLWNPKTGTAVSEVLEGFTPTDVQFSADGSILRSGTKVWDVTDWQLIYQAPPPANEKCVLIADLSPEGRDLRIDSRDPSAASPQCTYTHVHHLVLGSGGKDDDAILATVAELASGYRMGKSADVLESIPPEERIATAQKLRNQYKIKDDEDLIGAMVKILARRK